MQKWHVYQIVASSATMVQIDDKNPKYKTLSTKAYNIKNLKDRNLKYKNFQYKKAF